MSCICAAIVPSHCPEHGCFVLPVIPPAGCTALQLNSWWWNATTVQQHVWL